MPTTAEIKAQLDDSLAAKKLDEATRLKIDVLWPDDAAAIEPAELLDRLAASLAVVEPQAAAIVNFCQQDIVCVAAAEIRPARRYVSRTLRPRQPAAPLWPLAGQHQLVDESLEYLKDLKPEDVADPASLLFYQAVAITGCWRRTTACKRSASSWRTKRSCRAATSRSPS